MLVAVVGGLVALDQRREARAQERVAVARELAAASTSVVDEDTQLGILLLGILLAMESIDTTRDLDGTVLAVAESALHRAVTASRVVMALPGLGGSVAWSPDGTVFVTEGPEESGPVDLRDAETGESVLAFTGHDVDINDVGFSPDGSALATTGDDGLLRLWDPETGDLQSESQGRPGRCGASRSAPTARGWRRRR